MKRLIFGGPVLGLVALCVSVDGFLVQTPYVSPHAVPRSGDIRPDVPGASGIAALPTAPQRSPSPLTAAVGGGLMDNIIEKKRIEDMDGFEVAYEINGLKFVKYNRTTEQKPATVLFLPGLDGSGCTLGPQVEDLVGSFNLWSLSCPANDRSTFSTLTNAVVEHLKRQGPDTPTVVVGESFGGLLALAVALFLGQDAKKYVTSLFLVNPATSFANTPWQLIIPLFRDLPERFYPIAVTPALVAVGPDITQFQRVLGRIIQPLRPPWEQAQVATETVRELLDLIGFLTQQIPLDTLQWRITRWLQAGSFRVVDRLGEVDLPVVVAAGTQDRVLPSVSEARRLKAKLPDCSIITIQGSGHISLDERINMTDILIKSPKLLANVTRNGRPFDPVRDFVRPSAEVQARYKGIVERALERFTSPVFFSTRPDGTIERGLGAVPDLDGKRAILFVGNHQLIGLDLGMIIKAFMDEKNMLVRGLAHPALFRQTNGAEEREIIFTEDTALFSSSMKTSTGGDTSGLRNVFQTFGAVPVSARNFYTLLETGEPVLLFPGGARETYHRKGEEYKVFWPDRSEFVRMAATFNATVVPFAAIGCADSFRMVLDSKDLLSLPVVGERVRALSDAIPNARGDAFPEDFIAPVLAPVAPARFYFLFGKPISTDGMKRNKEAAGQAYQTIRKEVEVGIDALLKVRDQDPYKEFLPRIAYEQLTRSRAPSVTAPQVQGAVQEARKRLSVADDTRPK